MDARGRIIFSVIVIGFVCGAMAGAWTLRAEPVQTTYAGLFVEPVVDLILERNGGVHGFIGMQNLGGGDRANGVISVIAAGITESTSRTLDLDMDVRGDLRGVSGIDRLDDWLFVTWLSYGTDDLLSGLDGGFDLLRTIDRNPVVGNADGRLSLRELGAGANDLPPPGSAEAGGTPFNIAVSFLPDEGVNIQTQELRVTFVFQLSDIADADLN